MIVIAPATSCELLAVGAALAHEARRQREREAPTGTLTKKIHSQPRYFVSTPPSSTPTAAPEPPIAPQMPSALLRSAPSSKVVVMIESAAGEMIAAPRPCNARAPISTPSDHASPQRNDATVKTHDADEEHAPAAEQVGCAAAEEQEAAEGDRVRGDHPLEVRPARSASDLPIDGSATLTIETSRTVMKNAAQTIASAFHLLGSGSVHGEVTLSSLES